MSLEQNVLLLCWTAGAAAMAFLVPNGRRHSFLLAFLVCQSAAWLIQTFLVEWRLVAFPVREFPHASDLGLTTQLMFYPVCCGLYVVHEPARRRRALRTANFALWTAGLTAFDAGLARYTDLLSYTGLRWYGAALVFATLLAGSSAVHRRFFRNPAVLASEEEKARA